MYKKKLSIDEQIEDLISKNVKFELYNVEEAKKFLERTCEKNDFSQRARASCLKLARTIADMRKSSIIELADMEEAVSFRREIAAMEIAAIEMLV